MSTTTATMGLTCPVSTDYMDPAVLAANFEKIDALFPVGSIVKNTTGVNPATYIGGRWDRIQDVFLMAGGSTFPPGTTGGSTSMGIKPNGNDRDSSANTTAGLVNAGAADNGGYGGRVMVTAEDYNKEYLPPYKAVYVWERKG